MVTIIRSRIQDMVKKGMTLEQVKAAKPTLDYDGIYGEDGGLQFTDAVYRELAKDASQLRDKITGTVTMMMRDQISENREGACVAVCVLLLVLGVLGGTRAAQRQGAPDKAAPASARARAVIDVTGYWVSIIDEDWMWRMMTPAKGDYTNVPLNAEGKRVTKAWDPEKDKKEGNECRAYGAANIMRMPDTAAYYLGGRQHSAGRDRCGNTDAAIPL